MCCEQGIIGRFFAATEVYSFYYVSRHNIYLGAEKLDIYLGAGKLYVSYQIEKKKLYISGESSLCYTLAAHLEFPSSL